MECMWIECRMNEITPDVAVEIVRAALGNSWGCYAMRPHNQDAVIVVIWRKWTGPRGLKIKGQLAIHPFDSEYRIAQRIDATAQLVTRDALKKWKWVRDDVPEDEQDEWGGKWVCRDER